MLGRRGYGIGTLRNHAGNGNLGADLLPGQVPPDARLGSLSDFNLNYPGSIQIFGVDSKSPRGDLAYGITALGA